MAGPDIRYARSGDGTRIAFSSLGDGPPLLLVPPAVSHLELKWEEPRYAAFIRRMASFTRLIMMDKRGCGLSDRTAELPSSEEQVEDIAAVLEAADARPAWLFGTLDGAVSTLLYAAHHPADVRGVITYAGFARFTRRADFRTGVDPSLMGLLGEAIEQGEPAVTIPLIAPSMSGDEIFAQWLRRYLRSAKSPREMSRWILEQMSTDVRDVLDTVSVPVLVLHRAGDRFIPVAIGRDLAARLPNARFVELEGEDYFFFLGDSDRIIGEVEEFIIGTRVTIDSERALATILFTDIVRSTQLANELGDRQWRALLDRHDAMLQPTVARYRGRLIKTTGDGALMTFDGPARAARCASDLRSQAADMGLQLRAGIHTGEVELRDDDIGGMAVHIAARVQNLAEPDEILV